MGEVQVTTATVAEPANALATIVKESGLEIGKATALMEAMSPLVAEAGELVRASVSITVTDATQVSEMRAAREARLKLKAVRVAAENARKDLKADVLATGRAIDAASNWIKAKIEPEESRLEQCETFAQRAEAARKAALKIAREDLLRPFNIDTRAYNLADMAEATFAELLDSTRLAKEAREAEAKRQEEERKAAEAKREREVADARAKQAQAEKEREAIRAKAKKELAESEAKFKAEREAREKVEREQRDRAAAEAKQKATEAKAAKKAAAAPDAEKVRAFGTALQRLPRPLLDDTDAMVRLEEIVNAAYSHVVKVATEMGEEK